MWWLIGGVVVVVLGWISTLPNVPYGYDPYVGLLLAQLAAEQETAK